MKNFFWGFVLICNFSVAAPFRPRGINFPLQAPDTSQANFTDAFPNLTFNKPVFMTFAPGDTSRVFVVEQPGVIKVFPNSATAVESDVEKFVEMTGTPFMYDGGEMGLLGLAFSPDFEQSKELFICYTTPLPYSLVVARMKISANNPNRAEFPRDAEVFRATKTFGNYTNHNGGMIAFGPDRKLYIGVGDGGSAHDPHNNGQKKDTLWGKILRIDPLVGTGYEVPADNPFKGQANVEDEIFAYGIRNPWRFSFDRQTGELWAGDVGQGDREEINIIKSGGNYGWKLFEGNLNPGNVSSNGFIFPAWSYPHGAELSVTGGYVYRGSKYPEISGAYIYGDYASGRVWALRVSNGTAVSNVELARLSGQISSFAEDPEGELYILDHNHGKILRIEKKQQTSPVVEIPKLLSEVKIFKDELTVENGAQDFPEKLIAIDGLEPYEVNSPLWSDGAEKQRWLGLPTTGKIEFSANSFWKFPAGTIFVKHFELNTKENAHYKLETRIMYRHTEGWRGYTYVWNEAQTDAELIADAQTKEFEVMNAANEIKLQTWYYPSRDDCLRCHNFSVGNVLGVSTGQLNREINGENFLSKMNNNSLFSRNIGSPAQYQALPDPFDANRDTHSRARSYLAANCAHCHNPSSPAPGGMDFRYQTRDDRMNVIGIAASEGDVGATLRIDPGQTNNSALYKRMETLDPATRMPTLATSVQDEKALSLLRDWIESLRR